MDAENTSCKYSIREDCHKKSEQDPSTERNLKNGDRSKTSQAFWALGRINSKYLSADEDEGVAVEVPKAGVMVLSR